jgi:hypothetical protein
MSFLRKKQKKQEAGGAIDPLEQRKSEINILLKKKEKLRK